jgi:hypothetical protein
VAAPCAAIPGRPVTVDVKQHDQWEPVVGSSGFSASSAAWFAAMIAWTIEGTIDRSRCRLGAIPSNWNSSFIR